MLRVLVLLLLGANALFFAWTQGWLDSVVGPARPEREPQRMAAQVRPELVQILPPAAASAASSAAVEALASTPTAAPASAASAGVSVVGAVATAASLPTSLPVSPKATAAAPSASAATPAATSAVAAASPPSSTPPGATVVSTAATAARGTAASAASTTPVLTPAASAPAATTAAAAAASAASVCLEAGPYAPAEVSAAEAALKPLLASGGWAQRKASSGGEWMIYMGPYPDRESIDRKKAELARIRGGVPQEELTTPPELARGLSLGRFPSPAAANATLAQYRLRGIRTARIVQSSSGAPVVYLRVAQADPAIAARLTALKPPPAGRSFSACPR